MKGARSSSARFGRFRVSQRLMGVQTKPGSLVQYDLLPVLFKKMHRKLVLLVFFALGKKSYERIAECTICVVS